MSRSQSGWPALLLLLMVGGLPAASCGPHRESPATDTDAPGATPAAPAEPPARVADEHAARAIGWAQVTAPRTATLATALGVVRGVGAAAGAEISLPFAGQVRALHVAPGDRVDAGAPLMQLHVPELSMAVAEVVGAAGEARVHAERLETLQRLLEENLVRVEQLHESEHLLAEVRTRLSIARAKLRAAGLDPEGERALRRDGYLTLRAPTAGTVIRLYVRIGEATRPDARLARLVGRGQVRVETQLASKPPPGEARLETPEGPVPLQPLGPTLRDPDTGLYLAFFTPLDDAQLHDGERWPLSLGGDPSGMVEVPTRALADSPHPEGSPAGRAAMVVRRRDGQVTRVPVEVLRVDGASGLVRSVELVPGDEVATDPAEVLRVDDEP